MAAQYGQLLPMRHRNDLFTGQVGGHLLALHDFYGEFMGVRIARKHVGWYLQDQPNYRARRAAFNGLQSAADQLQQIEQLFHTDINEELAA